MKKPEITNEKSGFSKEVKICKRKAEVFGRRKKRRIKLSLQNIDFLIRFYSNTLENKKQEIFRIFFCFFQKFLQKRNVQTYAIIPFFFPNSDCLGALFAC